MLELRSDELPGCFGGMIAADAGLRVPLQFVQSDVDGLAVRLAHAVISADKRSQRNGFRSGKSRIPSGTMLDRCDSLSVRALILMPCAMPDKLLAGVRMLAFGQPRKLLCAHSSGEAELPGQPAMPLPLDRVALLPIVLLGRRELLCVVGLRLRWRKAVSRYSA